MRTALAAAVIAVACGATAAKACETLDLRQPGESRASANERLHRLSDQTNWAEANVVFVGELLSIRRADGVQVEIKPIGTLKGEVGTAIIRYELDSAMLQCGLLSWPSMEMPGVYFANRASDGELRIEGMLTYDNIRDQTLFDRLNEQIKLEPVSVAVRDGAEAPPHRTLSHWAWLAGTVCLSLLAGALIGRASRKASNTQKPRS